MRAPNYSGEEVDLRPAEDGVRVGKAKSIGVERLSVRVDVHLQVPQIRTSIHPYKLQPRTSTAASQASSAPGTMPVLTT